MRFKMMPASRKTVIRIYIAGRVRRPTRSSRGHDGGKSCSQLAARGNSISRAGSGSTRCLCSINFSRQLGSSIYCFVSGAPEMIRRRILPRPLVAVREDKRRAKKVYSFVRPNKSDLENLYVRKAQKTEKKISGRNPSPAWLKSNGEMKQDSEHDERNRCCKFLLSYFTIETWVHTEIINKCEENDSSDQCCSVPMRLFAILQVSLHSSHG